MHLVLRSPREVKHESHEFRGSLCRPSPSLPRQRRAALLSTRERSRPPPPPAPRLFIPAHTHTSQVKPMMNLLCLNLMLEPGLGWDYRLPKAVDLPLRPPACMHPPLPLASSPKLADLSSAIPRNLDRDLAAGDRIASRQFRRGLRTSPDASRQRDRVRGATDDPRLPLRMTRPSPRAR